jgi:hypothetical protein
MAELLLCRRSGWLAGRLDSLLETLPVGHFDWRIHASIAHGRIFVQMLRRECAEARLRRSRRVILPFGGGRFEPSPLTPFIQIHASHVLMTCPNSTSPPRRARSHTIRPWCRSVACLRPWIRGCPSFVPRTEQGSGTTPGRRPARRGMPVGATGRRPVVPVYSAAERAVTGQARSSPRFPVTVGIPCTPACCRSVLAAL